MDAFSKIMINMLDGTRKIRGNGRAIVDALKDELHNTTIKTRDEVLEILYDDKGVNAIRCKDGVKEYDAIISTLHPRTTVGLLNLKNKKLKRYAKHVNELEESPTFFSIFCLVEADIASNLYFYGNDCISVLPSSKYDGKSIVTVIARSSYEKYEKLDEEGYKKAKQEECDYHIEALKKEIQDIQVAKDNNNYDFATYFLIVNDYFQFARREGIVVGCGRGSGYASILLRALGITYGPDPLKFGLLWERFLGFDTRMFLTEDDFGPVSPKTAISDL